MRCSLPVTRGVQNRYGTLHGGCIGARAAHRRCLPHTHSLLPLTHSARGLPATIMDVVTTAALVSVSDYSGVSLELNSSYINPAKDGDTADIDARVLKAGGAVAVLACTVRARGTGRLVAEGRHTKYLPRTPVAPQLAQMLRDAEPLPDAPRARPALPASRL